MESREASGQSYVEEGVSRAGDHPLPRACEVTVNFQDYHRSSSKLGLDNFECLAAPMRRVEWRKVAT